MAWQRQPVRPAVASHRRRSAMRLRDWRVRGKLATVLIIPLLGFLVVAGVQITTSVGTASTLDAFAQRVAAGRQVTTLIHELQRERDRTAGVLAALATPPPAPAGQRDVASLAPEWTAVDRAADALRAVAHQLRRGRAQAQAYAQAEARLDELAQIRSGAGSGWLRRQASFDMYTRIIASLQALLPAPVDVGGDVGLGQVVRGLTNLSAVKELTAQIRGRLYIVCHVAGFESGEFEKVTDVRAEQQAAIDRFRSDANNTQLAQFDDTVTGQAVRNASRLRQSVISNASAAAPGVDPQQWWLASTTELELLRTVERNLLEAAADGVANASSRQWRTTLIGGAATMALLLIALFASAAVGRGMARTLRLLREQALNIAQQRLPQVIDQLRQSPNRRPPLHVDPIMVGSRDEIGEVAHAFTAVHRSAVRLAVEQAVMRHNQNEIMVKLARRSQTLVERQLRLLDTMEASEVDPEQLASLFRLDHLATRMRRNDENLLVLAGSESSRRWTDAVELNTIVHAATAEIEQYTRVRQDITGTIHLVGYSVTDLVHLIAELLENAAAFSPPDTTVDVRGWPTLDGGAALQISDRGFGMTRDVIAQANRQLMEPMSLDISAAERMGLVVVGHLARRHGIHVELTSHTEGMTVRMDLPAKLITVAPIEPFPAIEPARWLNTGATAPAEVAEGARRRSTPMRAEDVLGPGRGGHNPSIWWSRDTPAPRRPATTAPQTPRASPGSTPAGLPKRVRPPSLTAAPASAPPAYNMPVSAPPDIEPDDAGGMLTRLYSGVRRAHAESDDTEITTPIA